MDLQSYKQNLIVTSFPHILLMSRFTHLHLDIIEKVYNHLTFDQLFPLETFNHLEILKGSQY